MNEKATRALSLSFHGGTGTGKNYVSKIIAENTYKKGMDSKYVHLLPVTRDFPHVFNVTEYQKLIKNEIENGVKECPQSMFIFDEIDKAPPGVLDVISAYMEPYEKLQNIDFRKAIFIFLSMTPNKQTKALNSVYLFFSNTGTTNITQHALKRIRKDITIKEMEEIISKTLTNGTERGGLYESLAITKHLIKAYVPFLPLEEVHVKKCIKYHLVEKHYFKTSQVIPDELVQRIANELHYIPDDSKRFSSTGCKRVSEKIAYVMDDDD
ncbi:torsin-1A-like [Crassostrea virginica]